MNIFGVWRSWTCADLLTELQLSHTHTHTQLHLQTPAGFWLDKDQEEKADWLVFFRAPWAATGSLRCQSRVQLNDSREETNKQTEQQCGHVLTSLELQGRIIKPWSSGELWENNRVDYDAIQRPKEKTQPQIFPPTALTSQLQMMVLHADRL